MDATLTRVRDEVFRRNPGETEFHQAVVEVFESLEPVLRKHPEFGEAAILQRKPRLMRTPDHLPCAVG